MSELKTLDEVLGDKLLNVGDYQRPYAWEEKQLADLWTDLDLLGSLTHYAGTLVLQKMGMTKQTRAGQVLTCYEVVDGQQRLTTCVILLNRLARALESVPTEDAQEAARELRRLVVVNVAGVETPRVQLGRDLRRFFESTILNDEAAETSDLQLGEKRLEKAARYFDARLDELTNGVTDAVKTMRLLRLRARISFQLRFTVYAVESSDEVGVLFETVNGRGKALTEIERVKNYLLYLSRQLGEEQLSSIAENINYTWSEIFKRLGKVGLRGDALLRAHWLVTQDANTRNWHGADSVKSRFPRSSFVSGSSRLSGTSRPVGSTNLSPEDELFSTLTNYVDSLRKSAGILARVHDASAEYEDFGNDRHEIRKATAALRRSGTVAPFYPLIVAAGLAYPKDAGIYRQVIEFSERFSGRVWAICGLRSNAGESTIRWSARDLYMGKSPSAVIKVLEARLWSLAPDEFVRSRFDCTVNWYSRSNAHKFFLYEYELAKQSEQSDIPEFGAVTAKGSKTTEHILPQTPADNSAWWSTFTIGEHSQLVHGIGNLVLTRNNSRYGNRDYLDSADGLHRGKRGVPGQQEPWCYYNDANLARERELASSYDDWTPDSIKKRANELAEWALKRWPATRPNVGVESEVDDDRIQDDETDVVVEVD